jgi:hypothetical protein
MTDELILSTQSTDGKPLIATFLPTMGMNLISYKKGEQEVIDQATRPLFDERFAGLGALIGPHFHRRQPSILPKIADESLFPHIQRVKAKGNIDPFSHGIARYAPWKVQTSTPTSFSAIISGKDTWNGVPLAQLEGQQFIMRMQAQLTTQGLGIDLSVVSDTDSIVGIHYYYALPKKQGKVISAVQPNYIDKGTSVPIPSEWSYDNQHKLEFDLNREADFTFHPFPNGSKASILLDAVDYKLRTTYRCLSQENSWQLYHPKGETFVCIEPLSAYDPRHPNLTVSSLHIELSIE